MDVAAADHHGALKDANRRNGTSTGEIDTQMAPHALAEGLTLVTHNTHHFDQVPGLKPTGWMSEPKARARPQRTRS